jgi:poly(A) polymerase
LDDLNDTPSVAAIGSAPRIIARADHNISRSNISGNALRVLYRLKEAGYQAFLVGGCVRDVMLGRHPKDFDVATNALPDEVRRLFRNSRLVGRRFRLAHIVFGREVIEVATFRAATAPSPSEEPVPEADPEEGEAPELDEESELDALDNERVLDTHGRLLRDNVYGSIEEDVWRRDFTVNALYYNIADFSLWDYVGGAEDLAAHRLRMIGDPEARYREDPVRMLRAARFEAKLGFALEPSTAEPIARLRGLLAGVPAARLFDETLKLFLTGHGEASLQVLRRRELLEVLFPAIERYLAKHPGGWSSSCCAGSAQYRRARRGGQAGHTDVPVRPAAVRADRRGIDRIAAAAALARNRRDRGGLRSGVARGLGARDDSAAGGARAAGNVRVSAAAGAAARQARPAPARAAAFPRRVRSAGAARAAGSGAGGYRGLVDAAAGGVAGRALRMLDALPRARAGAKSANAPPAPAAPGAPLPAPAPPEPEAPEAGAAAGAATGSVAGRRTRRRRRRRRGFPGPA